MPREKPTVRNDSKKTGAELLQTQVYADGRKVIDMVLPKGRYVISDGVSVAAGDVWDTRRRRR